MQIQPTLRNKSRFFLLLTLAAFCLRDGDVQAVTSPYVTSGSDVPLNQSANDTANVLVALGNQDPVEGSLSMLNDAVTSTSPTNYVIPGDLANGFLTLTWDLGAPAEGKRWKLDALALWMNAGDGARNKHSTEIFTSTDGFNFTYLPSARWDNLQLGTGANYNFIRYDFSNAPIADVTDFQFVQVRFEEFGDKNPFPRLVEADIFASQVDGKAYVFTHPVDVTAFAGSTVAFTVTADGIAPFTYGWTKDNVAIENATERTLVLSDVQLDDIGDYRAIVSNDFGNDTSNPAALQVNPRPPVAAEIRIDFNHTGFENAADTETGFDSFALLGIADAPNVRTLASGVQVTVAPASEINVESRNRPALTNSGSFTEAKLLKDFVFTPDATTSDGLDIEIAYLKPNQNYAVTIWSYDRDSGTTERIADWFVDGELVETHTFTGTGNTSPVSNEQHRFTFNATANSQGTISISARKSTSAPGNVNCFLNALQLVESLSPNAVQITGIELEAGELQLTLEVGNPSAELRIDQTPEVGVPSWTEVVGVQFSAPVGNEIHATFPAPNGTRFYRAVVIIPPPLFENDFETQITGWTHGGIGDSWELGTPASGPGAAHSGTNCWATGLATPYEDNTVQWLRSPAINLTQATVATLSFWEFRDVEPLFNGQQFDFTTVNIKDASDPDGPPLVELAQNVGSQSQWTKRSFPLGPEALGKTIIVEFVLTSDEFQPSPQAGWFIDDVVILAE